MSVAIGIPRTADAPKTDTLLYVATQGEAVKLGWNFPEFSLTYCAKPDQIQNAATAVRSELQKIASAYLNPDADYTPYLRALAELGRNLRRTVFTDLEGRDRDDCLEALLAQPKESRLSIVSDHSSVEVPWGFIFTGTTPRALQPQGQAGDFDDFLLRRFKIRARYCNGNRPPKEALPRTSIKTLLAVHLKQYNDAVDYLKAAHPKVFEKLTALLTYEFGLCDNWDDCEDTWSRMRDGNGIFYIFAHQETSVGLCLEERAKIAATQALKYQLPLSGFESKFRKANLPRTAESHTLCFINGCRTAAGGWGSALLSATSKVGFHGFIGSEAEISNIWATRFAVEFLYSLLEEGQPVDAAFDHAQKASFPMGYWYSCYAQPGFSVDRSK